MRGARSASAPAWPKQIHVVDAIPLTSVGKIYKPELRCDAARRVLESLLAERLGDTPGVVVHPGGPHGLRVEVTLREGYRPRPRQRLAERWSRSCSTVWSTSRIHRALARAILTDPNVSHTRRIAARW